MVHSPLEHWKAFVFMVVATVVLYFNFAIFREQLCIIICPYGRFQSALIDDETMNVAYDYQRGNPPGHVRDNEAGDCIDCKRCIQVCPTGIDIRQGLQLECIGCAACVDACDEIMQKVDRPKGLIRYASDQNLKGIKNRLFRPRSVLYTALLFLGMGVAGFAFSSVDKAVGTAARMTGSPFYVSDTHIRNQYQIRLINKDSKDLTFKVSLLTAGSEVPVTTSGFGEDTVIPPMDGRNGTFVVSVPRDTYTGSFPLKILIEAQPGDAKIIREVEFLGPDPELLKRLSERE